MPKTVIGNVFVHWCTERQFQTRGPAAVKLLSPNVLYVHGTAIDEWSQRLGSSKTKCMSSAKYGGAWPDRREIWRRHNSGEDRKLVQLAELAMIFSVRTSWFSKDNNNRHHNYQVYKVPNGRNFTHHLADYYKTICNCRLNYSGWNVVFYRKCCSNSIYVTTVRSVCAISITVSDTGSNCRGGFHHCSLHVTAPYRPRWLDVAMETIAGADTSEATQASVTIAATSSSSSVTVALRA